MKIAISDDFLLAFSDIQKGHQKKVREFIERFRENPQAAGINYHRVEKAKDPSLFSVRIDQAYRAIVFHPSGSDVYLLTWVDHHDEAYAWAENKVFRINPMTGALQVFPAEAVEAAAAQPAGSAVKTRKSHGLFADVKDKSLLRLGIPEPLIPLVRAITSEGELEESQASIPEEAYEALYLLAAGYSPDEVFRELEKPTEDATHDAADFAGALENLDSQRRFVVVTDARELDEILNAPLEQWRVFLHPKQRKLVTLVANGPFRVLGGAGTGKTVVAMHRARHLVDSVFTGKSDRILFTTFTKNLATDIQENLRSFCSPEQLSRIEVVNLDGWVSSFLRARGYRQEPVFNGENNEYWENAVNLAPPSLDLPREFYRQEWEHVIQPQGISTVEEYLKASRVGRGTRISRSQRAAAWPVFQEYRAQLNEHGKREYIDMIRDARQLIESKELRLPYRAVVVDETQDMSAEALRLIRAIVSPGQNDLFLVGDAHQRIYRYKTSLSKCGIDIRGRGRKLKVNYRTTDEIRRFAVALLEGRPIDDLDGGVDDQKGYMSLTHGPMVELKGFKNSEDEGAYIVERAKALAGDGAALESICLVGRTKNVVDGLKERLRVADVDSYEIKRDTAENRARPGVRVATMHRVKGLEFEHVIVAGVNERIVPLQKALEAGSDAVATRDAETAERALLYVALTRARRSVAVTGYGKLSPFLERSLNLQPAEDSK